MRLIVVVILSWIAGLASAQTELEDQKLYSWHSIDKTQVSLGVRINVHRIDGLTSFRLTCLLRNDGEKPIHVITGRIDSGNFVPRLIFRQKPGKDGGRIEFTINGPSCGVCRIAHQYNYPTIESLEPGEEVIYYDAILSDPRNWPLELQDYTVRVGLTGPDANHVKLNGPKDYFERYPGGILLGEFVSDEIPIKEKQ